MTTRFWAKTGRGEINADGSPKYHPVICHLADTAAVAMEMGLCRHKKKIGHDVKICKEED